MANHHKVVIIGSGPAGFTAGMYASRANLDTVIFEGMQPGGQLMITTEVENFPGFVDGVQGPEMMEILRKQANKFGAKSIYETINEVDFSERPFKLTSDKAEYTADSVIIATGATARRLKIPSEATYWGKGISACATCDGSFFKNAKIFVVGGGDSAMEEALYLTHFGKSVTIIHRREGFRSSQIMLERAQKHPKIDFILNATIDEFLGEENFGIAALKGVRLKDTKTGELTEHQVDGVFYGIGHDPNTKPFVDKVNLDDEGYIITENGSTATNIPGVFAAGDCADPVYRQAITSAGSGCQAAIDAERFLMDN